MAGEQLRVSRQNDRRRLPVSDGILVEPNEDAFSMDFGRRNPCRRTFAKTGTRRFLVRVRRFFRRFYARETQQRIDLTQPFEQQDTRNLLFEAFWGRSWFAEKMRPVGWRL